MIGKVKIGKSFRGCLMYCLHDKLPEAAEAFVQDRAEVLLYNQCFGTDKELVRQFEEVRLLNQKVAKPVLHLTLSLAPGEQLDPDKWMALVAACAQDFGFQHNQYVAIMHKDTAHQHLHLVLNRIGFDGRTLSDSNSYKKVAAFCRKAEAKFGLQQLRSPGRFLPEGQQTTSRLDQRKELLKQHIGQALTGSITLGVFEEKMKAYGYQVLRSRGIAFVDSKKVRVKGSEVGFSLGRIERLLAGLEQLKQQKEGASIEQPVAEKLANSLANKATGQVGNKTGQERTPGPDLSKGMHKILQPEQDQDALNPELLKKKRIRHKRSPRL